ncbi:tetratricopeptide repeat protein [Lujinxingia vulgaris]|uniref:Tetratricopeptide repeat protein n=2 Tax=Lujinxingia vulgaris TaxID=2600176 RepID=A0A5C6XAV6_9DELT|nr:tetratricopeptide repeat protein [Lujinxingia vulgaris]
MVERESKGSRQMSKVGRWCKTTTAVAMVASSLALGSAPAPVHAQDFEVTSGDERQQRIVERYMELVESNPAEERHLQSLLFHVGRGSGLDDLIEHYRQRVEGSPESLNLHLVLGHLLRARGDFEDALAVYERAVELGAESSNAWLSRGQVRLMMGQRAGALTDFERALELEESRSRRGEILQNLAELSFSQRDFERGIDFYKRRIALSPNDEFVRRDFAALLLQYRQWEEALEQYDALLGMVGRDTARRAEFLSERAEIFASMGQNDRALESLQQAIGLLRADNWRVGEMRARMVDIYRQSGELGAFLERYARAWSRGGYDQQMLVADVYAETGELEDALSLYRRAASRDRRAEEPRQKIIRIYERMGREQDLPAAYRDLMRAAPQRHGFGLELARHHMRMGQRDEALDVLRELERRFSDDSYVLLEIADHYARWDMEDRAEATFARVERLDPQDEVVLLALAEFYFARGERQRAIETWQRLPESRLGRIEGLARMGEVMVDRGLTDLGVGAYLRALDAAPENVAVRRGLANALERARRWDEAAEAWAQVYAQADREQWKQEARTRIVELYRRQQTLRAQMQTWAAALKTDADVQAGFFLAEAHLRLREFDEGAQVIEEVIASLAPDAPEMVSALTLLERAHVQAGEYARAIDALERLAELRPELAADLLARMSEYALESSSEAQAVDFAVRSLEVNPDDARAQARVAGIYEEAGELEEAVRHYRAATEIDPQAFDLKLALGRALIALERDAEGDDVLWEVVRDATEDAMIMEAGEELLRRAARTGRLEALEARWYPLAFRLPVRDAHGRLLLLLYSRLSSPMLVAAHHGDEETRARATGELRDLGGRAASLLLDMVQRDDVGQRARALRLIAEMEVDLAVPMLARMIGDRAEATRVSAIVAAARLSDPRLIDPLLEAAADTEPTVRQSALWALGFMPSQRAAIETLREVVGQGSGQSDDQLLALASLARLGGAESRRVLTERLEALRTTGTTRSSRHVMAAAARAFEGTTPDSLIALLRDPSSAHSVQAGQVLGAIASPDAIEALWTTYLEAEGRAVTAAEQGLRVALQAGDDATQSARIWQDESQAFDWRRNAWRIQDLLVTQASFDAGPAVVSPPDVLGGGLLRVVGRDVARWQKLADALLNDVAQERAAGLGNFEPMRALAAELPDGGALPEGTAAALLWQAYAGTTTPEALVQAAEADVLTDSQALLAMLGTGNPSGELTRADARVARWLNAQLQSPDPELRLHALQVVARHAPESSELKDQVRSHLSAEAPGEVIAAAHALAALGAVEALQSMRELEADATPAVRRALREARYALERSTDGPDRPRGS